MALTSIRNEPCRIKKELQEMTDTGRYQLTTPGPGANVGFVEDPHIRLQKWGANLRTNTINSESALMGLTRPLTKDCTVMNNPNYNDGTVYTGSEALSYGTIAPSTEETRTIAPAWTLLDKQNTRLCNDFLHFNPQANVDFKREGCSTRIHGKNAYTQCFVKNSN